MSIQAIDRTSVHRLTSGQVIIDLQTAVKELVENALDAGATAVSVKFREHGLDEIEVEDNGRGIEKEDWPGLALKHHTSKLNSFDDLASVSTLGFRGEALSSLCGVATLSITTCTSPSLPLGTALSFTPAGELQVESAKRVSRSRGTTVKVEKLFENLPVRRKELSKNAKREMGKAIELVQAYALINTGVRFEVRNIVKGKSQVLLQTPISTTLRANFSNLFAPKSLASLLDLDLTFEVPTEKTVIKRLEEGAVASSTTVRVKGLISKPSAPHGRPAGNRQFYYVNGRPFSPAKVAKAVNESYKSFNANQFPTVVADFQLAPDAYDVNVSPDKRTIFLHSEGNLIVCLKEALARFFEPEKGTFPMQAIGSAAPRSMAAAAAAGGSKGPASPTIKMDDDEEDGQEEDADMEPPRKKKRRGDEDDSPGPSRTRSTGSSSSVASLSLRATASSRSSSIVGEVTNPIPPLQDEEVFLPEPPAHFYNNAAEEEDTKPAVAELFGDDDPGPAPQTAVLREDEGNGSSSLFRRDSPTPRPPPTRSRSPFEDELEDVATHAASTRPAPRLAQTKLTFLGGRGGSEEPAAGGGGGAAGSNKKSRTTSSTTTRKGVSSDGGETSAGRMQGILKQFLNGTPRTGKEKAGEIHELEDDVDDDQGKGSGSGEEKLQPDRSVRRSRSITRAACGEDSLGDRASVPEQGEGGPAGVRLPSDEDALTEQPEDVVMVVDESLCADAPAPVAAKEDEDEDDLEVVAASCACVHGSQESDLEVVEVLPPASPQGLEEPAPASLTTLPFGAAPSEVAGTLVAADAQLKVDMANLEQIWTAAAVSTSVGNQNSAPNEPTTVEDDLLAGAGIDERDEAAEATLSRVVSKADFDAMQVVGQFNLGFIIARRHVETAESEIHDDLFIVDQHASDEKYNFERLQAETVIQSQRLLAPRVLNLASADEITAMEHLDVLRLNGFDVEVDENAGLGERVKLTAQPVSRDTVFDVGDLEELVEMIATSGGAEVVRPTKARRMFASRACRKSVMIGKALNHKQMTTILQHMGGMEQPWACPHGRPTMRWLASVGGGASKTPAKDVGLRDAVAVLGHASP